MNRRAFIKASVFGVLFYGSLSEAMAGGLRTKRGGPNYAPDDALYQYLNKMRNFNKPHPDDIYLDQEKFGILKTSLRRLKRVHRTVGYGNFHLLGFDDALTIARSYSRVGRFSKTECRFLEWLFYENAALYGFYGKKPLANITDKIPKRDVVKIGRTGHYLFRGKPMDLYAKIRKDVGPEAVLTSGVRSVMKQTLLFMNKAYKTGGNLSMASRSLAPPGFSFHGIGDFDIGQKGYGIDNFTERFATTRVYKRLEKLGYVQFRYTQDNSLGVRFEPWHIKVLAESV